MGIIDADYYNNVTNEGHMFVAIQNEGDKILKIKAGEAFAQCIFLKYLIADDEDNDFKVRSGGLGSTKGGEENE